MNQEHLQRYEEQLTQQLLTQLTSKGVLDGQLLEAEELTEVWEQIASEYMVDAVPLVNSYPAVSMAWAAYIGMALATLWDGEWEQELTQGNFYNRLREPRGFDEMDEYILEEVLGLYSEGVESEQINALLLSCAHTAMALIRNEQIEAQSSDAFYVFARTTKVLFRIGVSLRLKQLGYKYEKVKIPMPPLS